MPATLELINARSVRNKDEVIVDYFTDASKHQGADAERVQQ